MEKYEFFLLMQIFMFAVVAGMSHKTKRLFALVMGAMNRYVVL